MRLNSDPRVVDTAIMSSAPRRGRLSAALRWSETIAVRWLVAALLLRCVANAAAGPIVVEIRPDAEPRDPFVVSVTGHYASIHNGTSRHWKDATVRAGARQFIALGPVNILLNLGVSVSVWHPEYVSEYARSHHTPLLLRPVVFETFRPRTWKSQMVSGNAIANGGPNYPLGQILGHFQLFLLTWLPSIDAAADGLTVTDDGVRSYLPLFEELARYATSEAGAARAQRLGSRDTHNEPAYVRSMAAQDQKQRVEVQDLLYRIREWLSITRAERVTVREMMRAMRSPRRVGEELMNADDRMRIGALLNRYGDDRQARREPEALTHWRNPDTRVEYRVRVSGLLQSCANLGITTDLTGVVSADLGDMTRHVKAKFCRQTSGQWRYEKP